MKLTRRVALTLFAPLFAAAALGQNFPVQNSSAQGSSPSVTVAPINTLVVARGGRARLNIEMQVNRGFHVNSNQPNDELLLPTVVHLYPPQAIMIVNIQYPEGEQLSFPFMGKEKLSVYSGDFSVTADVRVLKSTALGTQRVHGEVKFQACDNRQCFPPKSTPLEFDVRVVKSNLVKSKKVKPTVKK